MFENAERSQGSDNIALAEPSFARRSQCAGGSEPSQGSDNIALAEPSFARRSQSAAGSEPSEGSEDNHELPRIFSSSSLR
jgi:hypothetical protein